MSGRHTRSNPNTGLPNNALFTPNMLNDADPSLRRSGRSNNPGIVNNPPALINPALANPPALVNPAVVNPPPFRIQYGALNHPSNGLRGFAAMLNFPIFWPHLFPHMSRHDYTTYRWMNRLLGNPDDWPAWNPYRDPVAAANGMPVWLIPVECMDIRLPRRQWIPRPPDPRIPLAHTGDWRFVVRPVPQPCSHTEQDILTRGIEFYPCRPCLRTGQRLENTSTFQQRLAAGLRTQFPGHTHTGRNEEWYCSDCMQRSYEISDWTNHMPNLILPLCRECSGDRRQGDYKLCDCHERYSVQGGELGPNGMCTMCRLKLWFAAAETCKLMSSGIVSTHFLAAPGARPQTWKVRNNRQNRNNCLCGRHFADIWATYNTVLPLDPTRLDREIWRHCLVCQGFVPKNANGTFHEGMVPSRSW